MPLFELMRRFTPTPLPRHVAWWKAVAKEAQGVKLGVYVEHLIRPNHAWVCDDETFHTVLHFFATVPGWEGADGFGKPITFRPLSPKEEHDALKEASPELRAKLAPECACPPNAPRRLRRIADREWHKWIERRLKAAERASAQ
jgi:hypothetical protein